MEQQLPEPTTHHVTVRNVDYTVLVHGDLSNELIEKIVLSHCKKRNLPTTIHLRQVQKDGKLVWCVVKQ